MTVIPDIFRVKSVVDVVDGDTYDLAIDVRFYLTATVRVRLLGYDCPEMHGPSEFERTEAKAAREVATSWLGSHADVLFVRTEKSDDFGRWLGDVFVSDGDGQTRLGEALAAMKLATPWPTRWRDVYGQAAS